MRHIFERVILDMNKNRNAFVFSPDNAYPWRRQYRPFKRLELCPNNTVSDPRRPKTLNKYYNLTFLIDLRFITCRDYSCTYVFL
jgi:hypothetical protein